ncbi:hypothetical protein EVAR_25357_1 [Eumeta japonica]|uniref:Uncharacterized protein n=1 Tax=Eumeta variegata TaxID=151549 RepID=A0A4C1XVL0_EUMVA|nr:hypothetical protein EVAR_25357_1 [Eumeta japonica]
MERIAGAYLAVTTLLSRKRTSSVSAARPVNLTFAPHRSDIYERFGTRLAIIYLYYIPDTRTPGSDIMRYFILRPQIGRTSSLIRLFFSVSAGVGREDCGRAGDAGGGGSGLLTTTIPDQLRLRSPTYLRIFFHQDEVS